MSVRLENVVFFPEKNEFLVVRGGRFRTFAITLKGALVVKLKGFDRYFFDPMTDEVFSRQGKRSFLPLKKQIDGTRPYYWLYLNGSRKRVYKWEILRDNADQIEISTAGEGDPDNEGNELKLVS